MFDPPVLIQLDPGVPPPAYLQQWHPEPFGNPALAAELGLDRWYISTSGRAPAGAVRVEHDTLGTIAEVTAFPNDPVFAQQWGLRNLGGEGGGGVPDIDVDGLGAFYLALELDASGIKPNRPLLGVLDSELTAPVSLLADLPVIGYWNTLQNVPYHITPPTCTHAVHVTSIAASNGNNGLGMAGVAWYADVLAVQVLTGCFGQQQHCAYGVVHATDQGARVINMSLQYGATGTTLFQDACQYAAQSDVVIVAAAGNYSWTNQTAVPSSFPDVIAVGALRSNGDRPAWSNAGPKLELCAPGDQVVGLTPNGYQAWAGTSMASPHVAGAAALIRAFYPSLPAARVREILQLTADDMGKAGRDSVHGFGRLNAYKALLGAEPCYADFNRDGVLNSLDFAAFQRAFSERRHRANCTGDLDVMDDAILTVADFACFQTKFVAGCP